MKTLLPIIFLSLLSTATFAQNKSLGVGVSAPNPNAALHVESPTNNQGFIMPRLTTLQRTAMGSLLGTADNGLMLYDTDLKSIYFWNGTAWISSSQAASLTLPLAGTANSSSTAIDITNAGTGSAGNFTVNNATSSAAALTVGTNGTGNAITASGKVQASQFIGDGSLLTGLPVGGLTLPFSATNTTATSGTSLFDINSNPANSADIVTVAQFSNLNTAALSNVLRVNNAGTGALLVATSSGTGSGGLFQTTNAANTLTALRGITSGLGIGVLGSITNASSTANAVVGSTNGAGAGVQGTNAGTGSAGIFTITNAVNTAEALRATTNGTGNAARFTVSNTANTVASLYGITNGTGPGVLGENTGTGNGPAGQFNVTNAANATPALNASTVGTGGAGFFYVGNASNSTAALVGQTIGSGPATQGYTTGAGNAGYFEVNNAGSTNAALLATTNGGNSAGYFSNTNVGNNFSALYSVTNGTGSSGFFEISNAANTSPALYATTNGTGNAITALGKIQATSFQGDGSLLTNLPGGGGSWSLTGSAGTVDGTNFIGTTDNVPLNFRVFNSIAGRVDPTLANTFFGYQTGNISTTGGSNTAVGWNSLDALTTGSSNTAVGFQALGSNTFNLGSTAVGNYALFNSTANHNTAVGNSTLFNTTSGSSNTASGYNALNANTTGSNNTSMGAASLFSNTTGSTNTAIGNNALYTNTTGSNNIAIGNAADVTVNNLTNATAIGYNAKVATSNSLVLGGTGADAVKVGIGTTTPSQVLDVIGTVNATSFTGDGSALTNVIPSGIIMPFAGASSPSGYLLCDGSAVSRTTYANLFTAIGTSWGVGNGSTTFNLPDLRGRFMRGVDGGAGIDPDAASRTAFNSGATGDNVGSYQDDQFVSHSHNVSSGGYSTTLTPGDSFVAGLQGWNGAQTTTPAGGNETRPKNAYVNYIIKN